MKETEKGRKLKGESEREKEKGRQRKEDRERETKKERKRMGDRERETKKGRKRERKKDMNKRRKKKSFFFSVGILSTRADVRKRRKIFCDGTDRCVTTVERHQRKTSR